MAVIMTPSAFLVVPSAIDLDLAFFERHLNDLPRMAAVAIDPAKAPEVRAFIKHLLSGVYSNQELLDWWSGFRMGPRFFDPEGVLWLLRSLEIELEHPFFSN